MNLEAKIFFTDIHELKASPISAHEYLGLIEDGSVQSVYWNGDWDEYTASGGRALRKRVIAIADGKDVRFTVDAESLPRHERKRQIR